MLSIEDKIKIIETKYFLGGLSDSEILFNDKNKDSSEGLQAVLDGGAVYSEKLRKAVNYVPGSTYYISKPLKVRYTFLEDESNYIKLVNSNFKSLLDKKTVLFIDNSFEEDLIIKPK